MGLKTAIFPHMCLLRMVRDEKGGIMIKHNDVSLTLCVQYA